MREDSQMPNVATLKRLIYQKPECVIYCFRTEKILQASGGETQVTTDYDENSW